MKLYQALKEKNKIVGKINELTSLIQSKNSLLKNNPNQFDLDDLLNQLNSEKSSLISLKTRMYITNKPIQEKIFLLAELKNDVKFWSNLNTKQGTEFDRFSKETFEYVAHFDEVTARNKKEEIQKEIEKIQEELDYFNHVTDLV